MGQNDGFRPRSPSGGSYFSTVNPGRKPSLRNMVSMRKQYGRVAAAAVAAAAVVTGVGVVGSTGSAGIAAAGTAQQEDCPSVVALAARGSEENTVYAPSAANGYSDGHEGDTINRFLSYTTAVHPELFADGDRSVLTVDAERYPARFPVGEAGEDPDPATIVNGVRLFIDSMARGLPGGIDTVEEYERASGCTPDYVGLGYSQGVAVLAPVQHQLAAEGRLRGSVYFGNPFQPAPELIGSGAMTGLPTHSYCVTDDFACDLNPRTVMIALEDDQDAGPHASYFADAAENPDSASADERAAAAAFAELIR